MTVGFFALAAAETFPVSTTANKFTLCLTSADGVPDIVTLTPHAFYREK
jgi:hypothetical protein